MINDVYIHLKCKDPPGERNAKSDITKKAKQTKKTTATTITKSTVIRNTEEKKKTRGLWDFSIHFSNINYTLVV